MFNTSWAQRPFVPIATERLLLRPFLDSDAESMAGLLNDIRVSKNLRRVPFPYSIDDAHDFILIARDKFQASKRLCLAIIDRKTNAYMGSCSIEEELGIWLAHKYWGRGFGAEAMQALVHFGFSTLNLSKMDSSALENNTASRRIFENLGFQGTGTKVARHNLIPTSESVVTYRLTREEYFEALYAKDVPVVWVVAAALIDKQGNLLLAQRPEGKSMAGVWELPGGKIEPGETPEKALVRELDEELGISVKQQDLEAMTFASYHYHSFHLVMPLFLCRKWKGALEGREGQALRWITYNDLSGIPTPSADIALFHRLATYFKDEGIWE